ncbi:class I SAM-dependent methyltransferase [Amycolatopsis sp. EV170708-02-1]|uniref:methyltransferase n=1 Tax=Amycolatopsis sp. EV170708-02-1 TaxID=2919322 RepID=UPI001F0C2625|nr:class I SAM-dependent methyltransferase [Amycolatopsis sp. EV170708-02-1]UMP06862.1 class I SAM-dependent methyltransferase [Amycolatopsis sp. EV170708-02-1]
MNAHEAGLAALGEEDLGLFPAAMEVLERISLGAMPAAVSGDVVPRHRWLADRWRLALQEHSPGEYCEPGEEFERAYAHLGFPPEMAAFHREALSHLPHLLDDTVALRDLVVRAGDVLTAYQDNVFTGYLNAACAEIVRQAGPRVLELGGGAGLSTAAALTALRGKDYSYAFTDVSPPVVRAAEARFGRDPKVSFRTLDIDVDFARQGLADGSVDVVLAGNVLHNASDVGRTLRRIRRALAPGGKVVFTESTLDTAASLTSVQFLLSRNEPRERTPFLDAGEWRAALVNAGFAPGITLPEPSSPLAAAGQQLITATAIGIPADWPASKVLAHLERSRATEVVLPAAIVGALAVEPSLPLADLSALKLIRYQGGEVDEAARIALGVELARIEPVDVGDDFLSDIAGEADLELDGIDLGAAVAAVREFGRTALLSMLNALRRRGLFTSHGNTEAEVLEGVAYPRLLRRWLDVLTTEGLVRRENDLLIAVPSAEDYSDAALDRAWTRAARAWRETAGSDGTIEYARTNAERLPELIDGTCDAVTLLFPEGRTDIAEALYRENLTGRYQHRAVSAFMRGLVGRWPADRPLRVLEVGAGTGATTERVLPVLASAGIEVDYHYTDVSKLFLDQAAVRLRDYPWVRFGRFDIDVDPDSPPCSFDVVIGGGVLNAAADTDASVRRLVGLLDDGGWLVLTEPTVEEFWILTSQAFLMAEAGDGRSATGATFLTLPQWNAVLDNAGLDRVLGLPGDGHPLTPLGHRVFVARVPNRI